VWLGGLDARPRGHRTKGGYTRRHAGGTNVTLNKLAVTRDFVYIDLEVPLTSGLMGITGMHTGFYARIERLVAFESFFSYSVTYGLYSLTLERRLTNQNLT
jgi:hypothetical protein